MKNLAALDTRFGDELTLAAEMLAEREPELSVVSARADILGHLGDLRAILEELA